MAKINIGLSARVGIACSRCPALPARARAKGVAVHSWETIDEEAAWRAVRCQAGINGADVFSRRGGVASEGLPKDVRDKLHGAMVKVLNDPEVNRKLTDECFEVVANTPEQFSRFLQQELARWKSVVETGTIGIN